MTVQQSRSTTKKQAAKARVKPLSLELQRMAESVIEAKLPNGLRIRLVPNDNAPTCSFYTFFRVGSRNEKPGMTGISHLFEHMMFNGAKRYGPGEFDSTLESNGGTSNAYTSNDLTVYYEDFMSEALEKVIDLESDRMSSLNITPKMLESERQVVMEERRMRVDNEADGVMDEELQAMVFKAHPYRWPVIGWMGDIENITRDDCMNYFRTYYAPNNATIFVCGDFEPKAAMKLLKKYYGGIKSGPAAPVVRDSEPEQKGERRSFVKYPAQAPSLVFAWRGPAATHADTLTLDVLQYALSVGQSSRLTKALVYEQEIAVSVSVDWSWRFDPGTFIIALELKPDSDPAKAEAALFEQLERVARDGLEVRELQKAQNNLEAMMFRELATNNSRAHALGNYEMMLGSWRDGLSLPLKYSAVTGEQVKAAAAKYLNADRRSVVTLVPVNEEGAA